MKSHAPKNYLCPFCAIARNKNLSAVNFKPEFLVYKDKFVSAFISSKKWPKNSGVVIIIPNRHFENIFSTPDFILGRIQVIAKKIAVAMKKSYKSDGISTRQHNEPAGNQSVWHFHLQVLPRYANDNLYLNHKKKTDATEKERKKYALIIKKYL